MRKPLQNFWLPKNKNGCECEDGDTVIPGGNIADQVWQTQLQQRQIIINGEINDSLIERAVIQIMNINDYDDEQSMAVAGVLDLDPEQIIGAYKRPDITIIINTAGGLLDEAFSLISTIESSRTPINCIALGKAWSAGFLILLAGHKRYCQKYSSLMLHQGSAGIQDTFGKMMEYARYWESCQKRMDKYILSRTKITKKQLETNFSQKQDWYMDAEEALSMHVIDEII